MTATVELENTVIAGTGKPYTLDELVERLGAIPLARILARPAPGTATEADLMETERRYGHSLFELVDGVLVEKAMGLPESLLACALIEILRAWVVRRDLGVISGEAGMLRLFPGLIRIPDAAYISWNRMPDRKIPTVAIPSLAPDLAIEVLSKSNTPAEMKRKRDEYFAAGVRLVWEIEIKDRTISAFLPDGKVTMLDSSKRLDGGDVLPGFGLEIGELFGELDRHG